ncbi:hypothetical protein [Mesoaciditoga lauensis]|nr:hypothetical protein [Mesoaciditoga lauensis]
MERYRTSRNGMFFVSKEIDEIRFAIASLSLHAPSGIVVTRVL